MRVVRTLFVLFAALIPAVASAQVAHIYPVGDLPGGPFISAVRDATKHDGVIYAVGGSAQNPQVLCFPTPTPGCLNQGTFNTDTPVLWKFDGTTSTLIALPAFANNTTANNNVGATAITRDAAYIAGQARISSTNAQVQAMRVTVTPGGFIDLRNLANLSPALPASTNAVTVSEDGSVLYGTQALAGATRATRFDVTAGRTNVIPLLPGTTNNQPAVRGASSNGSVMVGTSFTTPYSGTTNGTAFRYVQGVGVSTIPLFPGATWSKALAVSPDGNLTLVAANSTAYPAGAMFLHNASTNITTPLRSPNTPYIPSNQASMTADGSVVVVAYSAVVPAGFIPDRLSYFHNSHGWFNLDAALRDAGVHVSPTWNEGLTVTGMSPDGTLVYGFGTHPDDAPADRQEGFVAEFPEGYLANYQAPRSAPDAALVGTFFNSDPDHPGLGAVVAFMADGSFYYAEAGHPHEADDPNPNGFERGAVSGNASGAAKLTVLQDTGGSTGLSGLEAETFTVTATDDAFYIAFPIEVCGDPDPANCTFAIPRIAGGPASIVGGWVQGNPALDDSSAVLWLLNDGTFFFATDGPGGAGSDGIEHGTYTWDPVTHLFSVTIPTTLDDTNGPSGLSQLIGTKRFVLAADGLSATISDNFTSTLMYRIGAPAAAKISLNGIAAPAGITVGGGATITVGVTNGPGKAGDWVALAPQGAPAGGYVAWKYLNDSRTRPATGLPTATVTFIAPDDPGTYEVVLYRDDTPTVVATSAAIAITSTTLAVNEVPAPGPVTVVGGTPLTVDVANGPGQPGDWLVLADTGAAPGTYIAWKYLNDSRTRPLSGLSTATVTFTAPTATGTYVVRLLRNDTQTVVATSGAITVAATTIAVNGNAAGTGASVTSTAPLAVVVTNGPGMVGDWVALAHMGAPTGTYIDWKYLNDSRTRPAAGLPTATVTFTAPVAGGSYEVRLLRNDTQALVASSGAITVAETALNVNGVGAAATVTVGTAGFVTVGVTNGPGQAGDWVALAAVGAPLNSYVAWGYLNNTHVRPASGSTAAVVTFAAPATPGPYEARLFRNDTFTLVARSGTVAAASAAIALNGAAAGAGITVAGNGLISVALTNGPSQPGDWVALAPLNAPAGSYVAWKYLNDSQAHPVAGAASAVVTFTAPTALGPYQVRLFRNDSFLQVASSGTISVAATTLRLNGLSTSILTPAGMPIAVAVVNGPGQPGDWLTLAPQFAPAGTYVTWKYLNDSRTRPITGLTAATVTLTAPTTPGSYVVRLLRNDTQSIVVTSAVITVP